MRLPAVVKSSARQAAAIWSRSSWSKPARRERHVGQDRHHVDDERLALGPVECLAPGLVDERQEIAGGLERVRIAAGRDGRVAEPLEDPAQRRDRLGRPCEIAVGLLPGQLDERLAVGGDHDRDPVGRREHRLDRRQAGRRRRAAARRPTAPGSSSIAAETPSTAASGLVRDPHLLEPQRQPGPETQHEPPGQDLVERRAGHRQDDRVASERVGGPERDPEAGLVAVVVERDRLGDRGREADPVAFEVAVVDPDRIRVPGHAPGEPRSRPPRHRRAQRVRDRWDGRAYA